MYFLHPSPAGCIPAAAGGEGIGTASASPLPDSPLLSSDRWTLPHVLEPLKALGGWSNNVWARRPLPAAHTQKHTHIGIQDLQSHLKLQSIILTRLRRAAPPG